MAASGFGIIAPHPPIMVEAVGKRQAGVTHSSADAMHRAAGALAAFGPETIVLMSPHAPLLVDAFAVDASREHSGSLSQFGDPAVHSWPGDPELAEAILHELDVRHVPAYERSRDPRLAAGTLDHGVVVPLSFLEPTESVSLVVLSLSFIDYAEHRSLGEAVSAAAARTRRRVAFIASGDLSHRLTPEAPAGYSARAADLDAQIVRLVKEGRLSELSDLDPSLIEAGGECGLRSFVALGGYLGEDPVPARLLSYEGPWGVGYLVALLGEAALSADDDARAGRAGGMPGDTESAIVALARATITERLTGTRATPRALDDAPYPGRAGAFVSLHRGGQLRGCIGTIVPTRGTLAEEVVANAIEAAFADPRFEPLAADELVDLEIGVDVLHAPEACTIADLDPARYGVIVTSGYRRGLLLPDLEGVDTVEEQVAIALRKAGIAPGSGCSVERFRVDRYT